MTDKEHITEVTSNEGKQQPSPTEDLWQAAKRGDADAMADALARGADANAADDRGLTALHLAVVSASLSCVNVCLQMGANPNALDSGDWTPLHYSLSPCCAEILAALLTAGADPNARTMDALMRVSRIPIYLSGRTPLHFAVEANDEDCADILVRAGADTEARDDDGTTPLQLAELLNNREVAEAMYCASNDGPVEPLEEWTATAEDRATRRSKWLKDQAKRIELKEAAKQLTRQAELRKACAESAMPSCCTRYQPLHPSVFALTEDAFVPDFLQALKDGPEAIRAYATVVCEGVYALDMLRPEYCRLLMEEALHYERTGVNVTRPNSMNRYGVVFNEFGFMDFFTDLRAEYIRPLANALLPCFPPSAGQSEEKHKLHGHHAFMVRYKVGEDVDLDEHVDNSEVTLNVCLGSTFEGGTVYFKGLRDVAREAETAVSQQKNEASNTLGRGPVLAEYPHKVGVALIHNGLRWHGANRISSGERCNLIVWCRSDPYFVG